MFEHGCGSFLVKVHTSIMKSTPYPRLCVSNIPKNVMIFNQALPNILHHQYNLICVCAPSPNTLVMGVVGFDKRVITIAKIFKVLYEN
jgi:hypothetical protein